MTFYHPIESAVLRSRLEAEGIECYLLDEYTVEANPFYSNAIGGVKLQVKEVDVPRAFEILKEAGYLKDENKYQPQLLDKLNKATSRLPIIKNFRIELRLMIIVSFVIVILAGTLYFATLPSSSEKLIKQRWCVDQVSYNGKNFTPETDDFFQITGGGYCQESISISKNGTIVLPGFNSRSARGSWTIDDNSFYISQADTFGHVYNGQYNLEFSNNHLILTSNTTTLYCYQENIELHLPF
jgi:hypothetical protein